jgi:hypothetical protein
VAEGRKPALERKHAVESRLVQTCDKHHEGFVAFVSVQTLNVGKMKRSKRIVPNSHYIF